MALKYSLSPQVSLNQAQVVDVDEIEKAISLIKETRIEIGVLKEIKIMIFKKRFVKNIYLSIHRHSQKAS